MGDAIKQNFKTKPFCFSKGNCSPFLTVHHHCTVEHLSNLVPRSSISPPQRKDPGNEADTQQVTQPRTRRYSTFISSIKRQAMLVPVVSIYKTCDCTNLLTFSFQFSLVQLGANIFIGGGLYSRKAEAIAAWASGDSL